MFVSTFAEMILAFYKGQDSQCSPKSNLVEVAGVEPASVSTLPLVLHA